MKQAKDIMNDNTRYPLGMHIDLQEQLYGLIQPFAPEKLLLGTTDIPSWKADIDLERDSVRETTSSEVTTYLAAKGKRRREVVTSLFEEIRTASKSLIENRAKAGHRLRIIIDAYKGIQRENMIEETGHVTGLLNDLDKPAAVADLSAIGLTNVVQMLRTVHSEFLALRDARLKDAAADTLPSGASLRAKNDATTEQIFRHIEAAFLAASSDEDQKAIGELIDRINKLLSTVKTTYRQRVAHKKLASDKKKDGKDKDGKTPKQPKEPKKKDDDPDIHLPEEDDQKTPGGSGTEAPKTPESGGATPEQPKTPEEGGGAEIHMPEG